MNKMWVRSTGGIMLTSWKGSTGRKNPSQCRFVHWP